MKVVSVNVGKPKTVIWKGVEVKTGIFKHPVQGKVKVKKLNLTGDQQADLSVHGGIDKAVYAYAEDHYSYWQDTVPELEFPFGAFGENLTVSNLLENKINIGDSFNLGTATLVATQPRLPCYKLGVRFKRDDMVKKFLLSGRTGIYFKVVNEGEIESGDELVYLKHHSFNIPIDEITRLYLFDKDNYDAMAKIIQVPDLPEGWKGYFLNKLQKNK